MPSITITKEFRFEAAHYLPGYDGLCANIHGHSYRLLVTLTGEALHGAESPKEGMLIDFSILKSLVERDCLLQMDHALIVREGSWADTALVRDNTKVLIVPFQPTCENLLHYIAGRLAPSLPNTVSLARLRLYETATNYAEWIA